MGADGKRPYGNGMPHAKAATATKGITKGNQPNTTGYLSWELVIGSGVPYWNQIVGLGEPFHFETEAFRFVPTLRVV